jgi:hypothetical protein
MRLNGLSHIACPLAMILFFRVHTIVQLTLINDVEVSPPKIWKKSLEYIPNCIILVCHVKPLLNAISSGT